MRYYLLEYDVETEINLTDKHGRIDRLEIQRVIDMIKHHCTGYINTFLKNNITLYRGMTLLNNNNEVKLMNTQKFRSPRGGMISKTDLNVFNTWLSKNDHASRDRNAVFTTTTNPDQYHGVSISEWYYFIPVDPFKFTYSSMVKNDFNTTLEVTNFFGILKRLRSVLQRIHDFFLSDFIPIENYINNKNLSDFKDILKSKHFFEILYKLITSDIMENDISTKLSEYLNEFLVKVDNINIVYSKFLEYINDQQQNTFTGMFSKINVENIDNFIYELSIVTNLLRNRGHNILNPDFMVDFKNSFITNEITPAIKDNEIWFNCKQYILLPYNLIDESKYAPIYQYIFKKLKQ